MSKAKVNPLEKVFNDPIHGCISLPSYCVKVIDTPEFQRMRYIKQLATTDAVYPGATHTRFAHSIGVCYLAGQVIRHLQKNQPELEISEDDVKCVMLAGLCHDLGHGPLSHKFTDILGRLGIKIEHEDISAGVLKRLNDKHGIGLTEDQTALIKDLIAHEDILAGVLKHLNEKHGISLTEDQTALIKKYITENKLVEHEDISDGVLKHLNDKHGISLTEDQTALIKDFITRARKRHFLYQIVANEENGVDVDKWDYFARDSYYLGMGQSFDHIRIIKDEMRVCKCKHISSKTGKEYETLEISFRNKLLPTELSDMFNVRWDLFQRAYKHETNLVIEEMYATAIVEYLESPKSSQRYGSVEDIAKEDIDKDEKKFMDWFLQLDDRVIGEIDFSNVESAKMILERIRNRDLYVKLGEIRDSDIHNSDRERKKLFKSDHGIGLELRKAEKLEDVCKKEKLVIIRAKHKYGNCTDKDPQNPLEHIYVFSKDDDQHAVLHHGPMKMTPLIPPMYRMDHILVYTRVPRDKLPIDVKQLQQLFRQQIFKTPPTGQVLESAAAIPQTKVKTGKEVRDPVHGNISLPDYCVKVIDTPEFQRLRNIRQLGMTEYVYPGATHTRFEHSIGVCHLAGQVINQLRDKHSEITENDIKCVQLAGLCQDIGHMPLSHAFSSVVERLGQGPWQRAEVSIKIVEHMLGRLKDSIGLEDDDIELICKLIRGDPPKNETRLYLYQILENKKYGVDVDKWDYIARDSYYCGVSTSFEMKRVLPFMEVRQVNGSEMKEISYRRSVLKELNRMFNSMVELKERVYEHRVVKLIEYMFADALYLYLKADAEKGGNSKFGEVGLILKNQKDFQLLRKRFLKLDDRIFGLIESSDCVEAKQILQRIHKQRNLYKCSDEVHVWDSSNFGRTSGESSSDEVTVKILDEVEEAQKHPAFQSFLDMHQLVIINHKYNFQIPKYGQPCYFYDKKQKKIAQGGGFENVRVKQADRRDFPQVPDKIYEQDLRLYSKADEGEEQFSNLMDEWKEYKSTLTPETSRREGGPSHAKKQKMEVSRSPSKGKLKPNKLEYD